MSVYARVKVSLWQSKSVNVRLRSVLYKSTYASVKVSLCQGKSVNLRLKSVIIKLSSE